MGITFYKANPQAVGVEYLIVLSHRFLNMEMGRA